MRIITSFGDRIRSGSFFVILSISRTRITGSLRPITSKVFSTVLYLLVYSFTVACVLHYLSTMPVGFNLSLTYGLEP